MRDGVEELHNDLSLFMQGGGGHSEEKHEDDDRQYLVAGHHVDDALGEDVGDKLLCIKGLCLNRRLGRCSQLQGFTGFEDVDDDQAHQQGHQCRAGEVDHGLQTDAPYGFEITGLRDSRQ